MAPPSAGKVLLVGVNVAAFADDCMHTWHATVAITAYESWLLVCVEARNLL